MPNNDLGTARGKVRIEYESKGAEKQVQSMQKMQDQLQALEKKTQALEKELSKLDAHTSSSSKSMDKASGSSKNLSGNLGLTSAAAARMIKQFTAMNQKLDSIDKSLQKTAKHLGDVGDEFDDGERAARGFSLGVFDAHKKVKSFNTDIRTLISDMNDLNRIFYAAKNGVENFKNIFGLLSATGGMSKNRNIIGAFAISMEELLVRTNRTASGFNTFHKGLITGASHWKKYENSLLGVRAGFTLLGTGGLGVWRKITGINKAMAESPGWVRQMLAFAAAGTKVATVMGLVSGGMLKVAGLQKLQRTAGFAGLVMGAGKANEGIIKLVQSIDKFDYLHKTAFGPKARKILTPFVRGLDDAEGKMRKVLGGAALESLRTSRSFGRGSAGLMDFAKNSRQLATGIAFITGGLKSLYGRFQWFFKLPKAVSSGLLVFIARLLPTALYGLGKALEFTSNLIAGLWSGIKQLGGGLTVIPGLFATIGAAVTSLIPVFAGLKNQFKDIFSDDPTKAAEAYLKMPAHLRPVASALLDQKKAWKGLQTALQTTAFRGARDDIKALGDTYFPLLQRSMTPVVIAFRKAKDELVSFALAGNTQKDVGKIYGNTATTFENLGKAIRPVLDGLRDMAAVGSDFLKDQTVWAGHLAEKFAEWARINRNNGRMMDWMQNARAGAFDLAKGLLDATKAAFKILTIFQTAPQGDFLQNFADQMKRFNDAVDKSKAVGFLGRLRATVQTMGAKKIEDVKDLVHSLGESLQRAMPFIKNLAEAFSEMFVGSLERASQAISLFLQFLNSIGATPLLGWIVGFAATFVLVPKYFMAAVDAIKIFLGAIFVLVNKGKVIAGIEGALKALALTAVRFGAAGAVASAGIIRMTDAAKGLIAAVGTFVSIATPIILVLTGIFLAIKGGNDEMNKFNSVMADGAKQSNDFGKSLRTAFMSDKGLVGSNVLDALSSGTDTFLQHLKDLQEATPGITSHLGDMFKDIISPDFSKGRFAGLANIFRDSDAINQAQVLGDNAKRAAAELTTLVNAGTDLNSILRQSDPAYKESIANLQAQGKISQETADLLGTQHTLYIQAQEDMVALGPAGIAAATAIDKIAHAAGDADTKLEGLTSFLQQLGFLTVDADEAATQYANSIRNLSEDVRKAIEDGDGLNNVFDAQGKLNVNNSQTAANLSTVFAGLSTEFRKSAVAGNSVDDMMAMINSQLPDIAEQLHKTVPELQAFIRDYEGFVPEPIKILVQLEGKEPLIVALGEILVALQAEADGKPIKFNLSLPGMTRDSAAHLAEDVNKKLQQEVVEVSGSSIKLKGGIKPTPKLLQSLVNVLNANGVDTVGSKADPGTLPSITPTVKPPKNTDITKAVSPVEEALAKLDVTAKDAASAIKGSADQFEEFLKMLAEKKAPQTLLDTLKQMRKGFEEGGKQAKDMADAIRDFSDKTIDADTRAQNFIKHLQGIGGLPDDSALIKYNQDIDDATGYQSDLVDMLDKTGAALKLNNGRIDTNSKNGRKLSETIQQLVIDSAALVAQGEATPEEAYANTTDVLRKLLNQFDIKDPALQQQIIDTYFPKDTFQKGLQQAMQDADPKSVIETIFHKDPAKLDSVINMLDSEEEILSKIVGPDGKIIIPVEAAGPGQPGGPPGPSTGDNPPIPVPPALPLPPPQAEPPPPPGPALPVSPNLDVSSLTDSQVSQILLAHPDIAKTLQPYTQKAAEQGKSFTEAFAAGIASGDPAVMDAIKKLAELAGLGLGTSPAKYGPLSGRGWTYYRGQSFTKAWASGIASEAGSVKGSVTGIAGEATSGLSGAGSGGADKTPFLGQLKELMDFFQHLSDTFTKIAEIGIQLGGIANTLSGGRLFPKSYVRDTSLKPPGGPANPFYPQGTPSNLRYPGGAITPSDTALASALRARGVSEEQIRLIEGFSKVEGNAPGGLPTLGFREDQLGPGADLNARVERLLKQFKDRSSVSGPFPAGGSDAEQAAWIAKVVGQANVGDQPADYVQRVIAALSPRGAAPGGGQVSLPANIPAAPRLTTGPGLMPGARDTAAILEAIFPNITTIGGQSNRPAGTPQMHTKGRALDVMTGGNAALGDAIAAFVTKNQAALGVQSYIWRDTGRNLVANEGGGPGTTYTTPGHGGPSGTEAGSHVHIQFADGATVDLSRLGTIIDLPQNAPKVPAPAAPPPPPTPASPPRPAPPLPPNGQTTGPEDPLVWAIPNTDPDKRPTQVKKSVADRFGWAIVPAPGAPPPPAGGPPGPKKPLPGFRIGEDYRVVKPGAENVPKGWRAVAKKGILGEPDTLFLVPDNADVVGTTFTGEKPPSPAGWEWKTNDPNWVKLGGKPTDFVLSPAAGGPPPAAPPAAPAPGEQPHLPPGGPAAPGPAAPPAPVELPNDTNQTLTDIDNNTSDMPQVLKDLGAPDPTTITTQDQAVAALQNIDSLIADQQNIGTAQSKATIDTLDQMHSNLMQKFGLKEGPSALDQVSTIVSGASSIAGDVFQVINSALEAVGATKDIGDTLVRGIENTEDIMKMIDDIQKYIALGADIAGAVGDTLGFIGSIIPSAGGADMGGTEGAKAALQAASEIAKMIQAALETVNAVIDLAQEAWHIIGSYVGDFLGYLAGGAGGFQGDVKFLLDETAGKLYAYGSENPQLKQEHNVPGSIPASSFAQTVGNINVYGGPGTDPRDDTRQMIFQIKAAQATGALQQ